MHGSSVESRNLDKRRREPLRSLITLVRHASSLFLPQNAQGLAYGPIFSFVLPDQTCFLTQAFSANRFYYLSLIEGVSRT